MKWHGFWEDQNRTIRLTQLCEEGNDMDRANSKNGKRMVFSEIAFSRLNAVLAELLNRTNALFCVFADVNGYPVSSCGTAEEVDLSSLTALAAGTFSATAAMAHIITGEEQFKHIFLEGVQKNIYLCNVSGDYLLYIVFDKGVSVGLIRVLATQAIARLSDVIRQIADDNDEASRFLDVEFKSLLNRELNRSFGL
jgi:predicted regulator of Ras-like GTPase activity (Roadblock/LC7/MglB family)